MRQLLILAALVVVRPAFADDSIDGKIAALAKAHKGKVAYACKHLGTGETVAQNGGDVMPTASLIKLAVMAEVYAQAADGKLKLDDLLELTKDEMVQGSGILTQHFSPGAKFSFRDATRLMIVFSDNTATNMVLEKIGIKAVNDRMAGLGFPETRVNAKVFKGKATSVEPARTDKYGLGSTTADETLKLLELLHAKKLVSEDASKAMLDHLKACDDKEKFPRFLPKGVAVAHKTGSVNASRTDAGILTFDGGPVALVVLTNDNADQTWTADNAGNKLCADIAKAVYDHYKTSKK